jgi:membrane-bound lytic murein transglycosylase B
VRLPALLFAATLLAAGCTSGEDDGGDAARATTTTTVRASTTTTTVATTVAPTTTAAPTDVFALRPPPAADGPAALAERIVTAESAIREPGTGELDLARAALVQQAAYRQLGRHPEWDDAVLDAVPPSLHETVRRHAAARRAFRGMHTRPSDTLPAWRIVEPLPAEELTAIYREAGDAFGIPWPYLAAINLVETATGRIRGTSAAGAQGPMQFLPSTWAAFGGGGDINDTRDAIFGAARYLAANNGATDIDHALFRYNHSTRYVRGVRLYADLIAEHPRAFLGLHLWGVWYVTSAGDVYLPVGYEQAEPIPVEAYDASALSRRAG